MDGKTDAPLLDLDTLVERPKIAIDGVLYEIRSPHELSVIDSHRFGRWGKRIDELADQDGEAAEAELAELVEKVARRVAVGVPEDVFAKLNGAKHWALVDLFTGLLLREKLSVAGAMVKATGDLDQLLLGSRTGAGSSRGSSGSTAAARSTGWSARLRRWCGLS